MKLVKIGLFGKFAVGGVAVLFELYRNLIAILEMHFCSYKIQILVLDFFSARCRQIPSVQSTILTSDIYFHRLFVFVSKYFLGRCISINVRWAWDISSSHNTQVTIGSAKCSCHNLFSLSFSLWYHTTSMCVVECGFTFFIRNFCVYELCCSCWWNKNRQPWKSHQSELNCYDLFWHIFSNLLAHRFVLLFS